MRSAIVAISTFAAFSAGLNRSACAEEMEAQPTLFCVGEVAGGLRPSNGKWTSANFSVEKSKYIVEPNPTQIDPLQYQVTVIGDKSPIYQCSRMKFPDGEISVRVTCGGMGWGMMVDLESLRFVEIYTLGYIENDLTGNNTPSITAGVCSKLAK